MLVIVRIAKLSPKYTLLQRSAILFSNLWTDNLPGINAKLGFNSSGGGNLIKSFKPSSVGFRIK